MPNKDFILDREKIRRDAEKSLENGVITPGYKASKDAIVTILQEALATELVCSLRYKQNAIIADDLGQEVIASEFQEHAQQEMQHAENLALRMAQLGASPDFNPEHLTELSHAKYTGFTNESKHAIVEMLKANLIAERVAIETYQEVIRFIGDKDPTTRRLFEHILEDEEEHADDLVGFLNRYDRMAG